MGTIRRVTRNVKRWRDAGMALRWVAAGMIEANQGFRRLKAHKQLPVLRAALQAHQDHMTIKPVAHVTRAAHSGNVGPIGTSPFSVHTPDTIACADELERELRRIRRDGFAVIRHLDRRPGV